jgi:hypothetical protein
MKANQRRNANERAAILLWHTLPRLCDKKFVMLRFARFTVNVYRKQNDEQGEFFRNPFQWVLFEFSQANCHRLKSLCGNSIIFKFSGFPKQIV